MRLFTVILCIVQLVPTSSLIAGEQANYYERELGSTTSQKIKSGYLLYNGTYIKPPYIVKRYGRAVLVNDLPVVVSSEWPCPDLTVKTDPGLPVGLTKNSKWEDLVTEDERFSNHYEHKCAYLVQHSKSDAEYIEKVIAYLKSLPCIKSVGPSSLCFPKANPDDPSTFNVLAIKLYCGEWNNLPLFSDKEYKKYKSPSTYMIEAKGRVILELEHHKAAVIASLEDDEIVTAGGFIYHGYDRSRFGPLWLLAIEILKSKKTAREKLLNLQRTGLFSPSSAKIPYSYAAMYIFNAPDYSIFGSRLEADLKQYAEEYGKEYTTPTLQELPLIPNAINLKADYTPKLLKDWWASLQDLPENKWGPKLSLEKMPEILKEAVNGKKGESK